jgi:hypothetical protein
MTTNIQDVGILIFSGTKAQDFKKCPDKNCNNIGLTTHIKIIFVPALA